MMGIEEILLTLVLNYTTNKIKVLLKGGETLEADLLRSYSDALNEWCKNDDIRNRTARNFQTHFKELGEYLKSANSQVIGTEISKLLNIWGLKLRNYDKTYHYILEKKSEKIYENTEYIRSFVDRIYKRFEVKIQHFEPILDYIPRQVSMEIDTVDFFTPKSLFYLSDIIVNKNTNPQNLFVLYSGAQTGKTTELQFLAYQLQESKLFIPFFYNLNNYTPSDLFDRLKNIAFQYDGVVLILDAYDEIKDANKDEFIKKLDSLASDFPNISILISSRKNFEDKNIFKDFQPLYLEPLSNDDIHAYIDKNYEGIRERFLDKAYDLGVFELLQTPFYLKEMLKYFCQYQNLPKNKSELYDILINQSFAVDEKHKQEIGSVLKIKTKGYKILQKATFVMTLSEKKELNEEELYEILEDEFQITLHFSIFKRDSSTLLYSFEHVAFKEFLMAKFLTSISEQDVAKLIFYPESNKLIKSQHNTVLLFLELIQDTSEKFHTIIDILIENDNHLIVEASPKFLRRNNRIEIFKKIYNTSKNKRFYIDYGFGKKLMAFAKYEETILFLLEQLKSDESIANYRNSLSLLEYADYNELREKEYATQAIKDFLGKKYQVKELRDYVLLPFKNEEYANKKDIGEVGEIIKDSTHPEILNDYFELLLQLDNLDEYSIDIFTYQKHITDYSDEYGVHHMISRYIVYQIYDRFSQLENIAVALIYTASEEGYLSRRKDEQIGIKKKLLIKLSDFYRDNPNENIIKQVLEAFVNEDFSLYNTNKYEIETALLYKEFFESTGQVESILNHEYTILKESSSKTDLDYRRMLLIPLLMTEEYFMEKMQSYDKVDYSGYQKMQYSLFFNDELRKKLSQQLDEYFSIPKPKFKDLDKEKQDDFDLILDYPRFKKEIEYHCDRNCELVYKFRNRKLLSDDNIFDCVDFFLYEFTIDEKVDIEMAIKAINHLEKYNKFALFHILHYMHYRNEKTQITTNEKQKRVIYELVNHTIEKGINNDNLEALLGAITFFDFDLTEKQIEKFMSFSYRNIPNHIGYKYRLTENDSDDLTFSYNTSLLELLIHKSSKEFVNNQIVRIVESENQYNDMLYRYFSEYISKNKIKYLYRYLPIILFDKINDEYEKRQALYYISGIEDSFSLIEYRFEELSDESKVSYFSPFRGEKVPKSICEILWVIYRRTDDDLRLRCLSLLLINGCKKALEEFRILLQESQYVSADKFPRLSYAEEEYLETLIEILEIILPKVDVSHNRFVDVVLYPIEEIAIKNWGNLEKVTKALEDIIDKNNNFHFLNRRIISITDRFYESGHFNYTIKQALKLFQNLTK